MRRTSGSSSPSSCSTRTRPSSSSLPGRSCRATISSPPCGRESRSTSGSRWRRRLSAPFQPEKAETVTADQIRRILAFLRQHYDYIIVDTPRSFAPQILAVFEQADLVFIVSTVDLPSLRNIQRGFPLLKRVLPRGEEQVRLVLNRYNPDDAISPADVERSLGLKVFWKVSNDYEAV